MNKALIVGICGGSGSGKTIIANQLSQKFKNSSVIINQDCYYKDLSSISFEMRCNQNFDHPDSIDFKLMRSQILNLLKSRQIKVPIYDFTKHVRTKKHQEVDLSKIIILDGTLIFSQIKLVEIIDLKVFIDVPDSKRLKFRQQRDALERGRTLESINKQYTTTVRPMYNEFVDPSKKYADIIITDPKTLDEPVQIIQNEINKILD